MDINPEPRIIGEVLLITVYLVLDPLNSTLIIYNSRQLHPIYKTIYILTIDISSIRVIKPSLTIPVSSKPNIESILLFPIMSCLDVLA